MYRARVINSSHKRNSRIRGSNRFRKTDKYNFLPKGMTGSAKIDIATELIDIDPHFVPFAFPLVATGVYLAYAKPRLQAVFRVKSDDLELEYLPIRLRAMKHCKSFGAGTIGNSVATVTGGMYIIFGDNGAYNIDKFFGTKKVSDVLKLDYNDREGIKYLSRWEQSHWRAAPLESCMDVLPMIGGIIPQCFRTNILHAVGAVQAMADSYSFAESK